MAEDANLPTIGGWLSIMALISAGILPPLLLLFGMRWVLNHIPPFILTLCGTVFTRWV